MLAAWLVFLGIDFLFHAGILESLWMEEVAALKPVNELAALIPVGYLSFFLLTTLIGYTLTRISPGAPLQTKQAIVYGLTFGALFSGSNLLGLYSYAEIPLRHLVVFNLVYWIEIVAASVVISIGLGARSRRRVMGFSVLCLVTGVLLGLVFQNLL